jgi:hypothetical protein
MSENRRICISPFQRPRARTVTVVPDAADLGTCFGLEASLERGAGAPDGSAPHVWQPPRWVQRLTARRRAT